MVVDNEIQSRVRIDLDHQRELSDGMLRGDVPPPVTVFFDQKHYRLADGFHRYGAYKVLCRADPHKYQHIRAEIRTGGREEAIIFSAGSNQRASLPRTFEDKKKAVYMLLDIEVWRTKSGHIISAHTGINPSSVTKWRNQYFVEKGVPKPDLLECADGLVRKPIQTEKRAIRLDHKNGKPDAYVAKVKGKRVYLCGKGLGLEEAERRLQQKIQDESRIKEDFKMVGSFVGWLATRGIVASTFFTHEGMGYPGFSAIKGEGFVASCTDFEGAKAAMLAISRAFMARLAHGPHCRAVVLCNRHKGPAKIMDLARSGGIEFMTPEEFVESLK